MPSSAKTPMEVAKTMTLYRGLGEALDFLEEKQALKDIPPKEQQQAFNAILLMATGSEEDFLRIEAMAPWLPRYCLEGQYPWAASACLRLGSKPLLREALEAGAWQVPDNMETFFDLALRYFPIFVMENNDPDRFSFFMDYTDEITAKNPTPTQEEGHWMIALARMQKGHNQEQPWMHKLRKQAMEHRMRRAAGNSWNGTPGRAIIKP